MASELAATGEPSLVTGATGFVGRHLLNALVARGHPVTALCHRQAPQDNHCGVRWHRGDVLSRQDLLEATQNVSVVYHLVATVPGRGSHREQWRVNYEGSRTLLQACIENGVKRLVFLSSVCAYSPPLGPLIDEDWPIGGGDSYGASKAAAEWEIGEANTGGLCRVILRPCQVYGPGDNDFTEKLLGILGRRILFSAGRAPRPFSLVYIDDLIEAIVRAGSASTIGPCMYNIAGPTPTSLQALLSAYAELTGRRGKLIPVPSTAVRFAQEWRWFSRNLGGNAMRPHWKSYASNQLYGSLLLGGPVYSGHKAKLELSFEPKVAISEGLSKILASRSHLRQQNHTPKIQTL